MTQRFPCQSRRNLRMEIEEVRLPLVARAPPPELPCCAQNAQRPRARLGADIAQCRTCSGADAFGADPVDQRRCRLRIAEHIVSAIAGEEHVDSLSPGKRDMRAFIGLVLRTADRSRQVQSKRARGIHAFEFVPALGKRQAQSVAQVARIASLVACRIVGEHRRAMCVRSRRGEARRNDRGVETAGQTDQRALPQRGPRSDAVLHNAVEAGVTLLAGHGLGLDMLPGGPAQRDFLASAGELDRGTRQDSLDSSQRGPRSWEPARSQNRCKSVPVDAGHGRAARQQQVEVRGEQQHAFSLGAVTAKRAGRVAQDLDSAWPELDGHVAAPIAAQQVREPARCDCAGRIAARLPDRLCGTVAMEEGADDESEARGRKAGAILVHEHRERRR
jgi:hypothetical protein